MTGWGDWTPTSVDQGRKFGQGMMQRGVDSSPVGHWTQALARVLQAGSGSAWTTQANEGERAGNQGVADTIREGIAKGLPMKQLAATLMGNPFGAEQGKSMAVDAMRTEQAQAFQRSQQDRQFQQQMRAQNAQFGQARSMAELQHQLQLKLMQAKSQEEQQQLIARGRALGIIPPEGAPGASPQPAGQAPTQPAAQPSAPQTGQPAPQQPQAPPPQQSAAPADPYDRMLTPSRTPEQLMAERRERAARAMAVGDAKGAAKIMNGEDDLKEYQTKDALWAERMMRSEVALRGIERQYSGTAGQGSPASSINRLWPDTGIIADLTNSQSWREYQQASREWIAAMLRKDTGAAVTETEWKLYFPTFFPQPGDSAQVLEQKRASRMAAAGALREASGPAFQRMFPNSPSELRGQIAVQNNLPPRNAPPTARTQPAPARSPQAGAIEDGFRFKGGDPAKRENWEPAQ